MSSPAPKPPVWRSTFVVALAGSALMWAALPPLALGWLGWIAPVPWLLLVRAGDLPGRRPYLQLYLAGLLFWLVTIHWIRLPHPLLHIGWIALSAYLAIYLPLFVGLSRVAMQRLALPLWLAAPIVFTGLELGRAHVMTGFLMASLAHTQVNWLPVIQISDLVGEYGVDFVVMVVAACVTEVLWIADCGLRIADYRSVVATHGRRSKLWRSVVALVPAVVLLTATLAYGHWRISQADEIGRAAEQPGPIVALIQGNSRAEWKQDPTREREIMRQYVELSEKAVVAGRERDKGRPPDLVIWPETMFRSPLVSFDSGFKLPPSETTTIDEIAASYKGQLANLAARLGLPVLVGIDRIHYVADDRSGTERPTVRVFNSSVLVDRDGKIIGTYDKIHRVMFGEFIPFADWIPLLYKITPLTGGIVAGTEPAALKVGDYCFAPNICYETAIPHVIRRQVATLQRRGEYPTALVNLTNDAWYRASSELDMHVACDIFRAVETRVPLVIAANGGISASVDRTGRVQSRLGKQEAGYLLAEIEAGQMTSLYVRFGDWFAALCLAACIYFVIVEWRARRALRHRPVSLPSDARHPTPDT
jgi:apolipoprotein N-acyltransferase